MHPNTNIYPLTYPTGIDIWNNQNYPYNNINMAPQPYQPNFPIYQPYTPQSSAVIKLDNEEEWKKFGEFNEMIVNKKGRSLFPLLNFTIDNIDENGLYTFSLTMERIDNKRYRYSGGEWKDMGNTDVMAKVKEVRHPDGYKTGNEWMNGNISFSKLKITNNYAEMAYGMMDEKSKMRIVLQTMTKYRPVLSLIQKIGDQEKVIQQFRFEDCAFITVTGYQDQNISKLKVENNKYARKRELKTEVEKNDDNKEEVKRRKHDCGYTMMNQQSSVGVSHVPYNHPYYPTPPPSTSPPAQPLPQFQHQPPVGMCYTQPTPVDHSMYNPIPLPYQPFDMCPQYGNRYPPSFQ